MGDRRRFVTQRFLPLLLLSSFLTGCGTQAVGGRWRTWVWIVLLLMLAAVSVLLSSAIVTWQKRMARVRYRVDLRNEGNVATKYAVQAEAPEGGLDFLFLLRGMALRGGSVTGAEATADNEGRGASPAPGNLGKSKRGKGFLNIASLISGLLINVGNLLPYDVGVHFIRIGSKMRRGQGSVEHLGRMSGRMSKEVSGAPSLGRGASGTTGRPETLSSPPSSWVETPTVAPGETLTLELQVSPDAPYRAQRLSCVLRSRSLAQESDQDLQVVNHQVELSGLTPFQTYSPFLLLLMGVIVVLVVALQLIGS